MKLISLNAWAGCVYEPLMQFIVEQSSTTDVLCFQEMTFCQGAAAPDLKVDDNDYGRLRTDLFGDITRALPDFEGIAYPALEGSKFEGGALPEGMQVGQAIFVRKRIGVTNTDGLRCFDLDGEIAREKVLSITGNCQWVELPDVMVMNLHGLWQKEGKGDTPDRLQQSEIVTAFMQNLQKPVVLTGDFNMLPNTESFRALARGKQDLIDKYGIQTTRSSLYTKGIPFSDYALCSEGLQITEFAVPDLTISDHLPMILELSVG